MNPQSQQGCQIRTDGLSTKSTATQVSAVHSFIEQESGLHIDNVSEWSIVICYMPCGEVMVCLPSDWLIGSCMLIYLLGRSGSVRQYSRLACLLYNRCFGAQTLLQSLSSLLFCSLSCLSAILVYISVCASVLIFAQWWDSFSVPTFGLRAPADGRKPVLNSSALVLVVLLL